MRRVQGAGECGPRGTECRARECVRGVPGVGCKTVAVAVVAVAVVGA